MNFTPEERNTYEDHLKWLRVKANTLKKAHDEGKAEEKAAIAKNLLQAGVGVKLVAQSTGLTTLKR